MAFDDYGDDEEELDDSLRGAGVGEAILNELVKSYGFGRNADGSWDWQLERITRAFEEDTLTTTLDYLSLGVPVAKWATAVKAVKTGSQLGRVGARVLESDNVARKALAAGDFAGQAPRTFGGKVVSRFVGDETARAAEVYREGASPFVARTVNRRGEYRTMGIAGGLSEEVRGGTVNAGGRTFQLKSEYEQLLDKHGAEWWEERAVARSYDRERKLEEAANARMVSQIQEGYTKAGLSPAQLQRVERLVGGFVEPGDRLTQRVLGGNEAAMEAYRKDFNFRFWLHGQGYDLGFYGRETYERGLKQGVSPQISRVWEEMKARAKVLPSGSMAELTSELTPAAQRAGRARRTQFEEIAESQRARRAEAEGVSITDLRPGEMPKSPRAPVSNDAASLQRRKYTASEFEKTFDRVLDPRASLERLLGASQLVARQRFAQSIAGSTLTASTDDLRGLAETLLTSSNPRLAKLHGISRERLEAVRDVVARRASVGRTGQADLSDIGKALGWVPVRELMTAAGGGKIPSYLDQLPKELMERWIDPAVAGDLVGSMTFMSDPKGMGRLARGIINTFAAMKTAYNFPAAHIRNLLGGPVFDYLHNGGVPDFVPWRSFRASKGELAAWESAVGGSASFSNELREGIKASGITTTRTGGMATALDWMGEGTVAKAMQAGGAKLERMYRGIDELWSQHSWMKAVDRYRKSGETLERARELATLSTRKFLPNYGFHSDLAEIVRTGVAGPATAVPFTSFTVESMKIYKNALTEVPHRVFFLNHFFDTMGEALGATQGFTPQQIEEAKQALPEYTEGKKMLLLPFKVDGQARFLDLSYLIPMANLAEAQQADQSLGGQLFNVSANPLLSTAIAAFAEKDPFTGREIAPRFTERQLGVPVTGQGALGSRKLIGLAEHMAAMMLPPWAPPGYAGVNLMEAARGQLNPATGEPLEDGVLRTIVSNLGSFRTYTPDVESQVQNVRTEQRRSSESATQAWERWDFARLNGDESAMEAEEERILQSKIDQGFTESEAREYFADSAKRREPFSNMSRRQLREVLERAERLGELSAEQEEIRGKLEERVRRMGRR